MALVELEISGTEMRTVLAEQETRDQSDATRLVIVVDDVDQANREVSDKGVVFVSEPA